MTGIDRVPIVLSWVLMLVLGTAIVRPDTPSGASHA
jgi:hypothetical protein